jgi:hypothetical protein
MKPKITVKYHTDEKPDVYVHVSKVARGVYYIFIDYCERFYPDTDGSIDTKQIVTFAKDDQWIFDVEIDFGENGWFFTSADKKCTHVTFYNYKEFEKVNTKTLVSFCSKAGELTRKTD